MSCCDIFNQPIRQRICSARFSQFSDVSVGIRHSLEYVAANMSSYCRSAIVNAGAGVRRGRMVWRASFGELSYWI